MLRSLEGDEIKCMVRLDFPTTNNEVKYKCGCVLRFSGGHELGE